LLSTVILFFSANPNSPSIFSTAWHCSGASGEAISTTCNSRPASDSSSRVARKALTIAGGSLRIKPTVSVTSTVFEADFYYEPGNAEEASQMKKIYADAAAAVLNAGGFFTRPYGVVADMVYERTAGYTAELKKIKQAFDPNNIMSPGRLCF